MDIPDESTGVEKEEKAPTLFSSVGLGGITILPCNYFSGTTARIIEKCLSGS